MKNLKRINVILLIFLLTVIPSLSFAGGRCYCGRHYHNWYCWWYGCNHSCGGGNDVPLDGGLSLLLVAGAGLGVKKAVQKRKEKRNEDK